MSHGGAGTALQPFDGFISYHWRDYEAVSTIVGQLDAKGVRMFLDRRSLPLGLRWQQQIRDSLSTCRSVIVFVGPGPMGNVQQWEIDAALLRQHQDTTFPVIPVLLPGSEDTPLNLLNLNTWLDLRKGITDESRIEQLAAAIVASRAGSESKLSDLPRPSICPYRGLQHFREEDSSFFYGREKVAATLLTAVLSHPFVTVVGPSGAGKSSLLRAGLVPRLRRERGDWDLSMLIPGDRPLHALARSVLSLVEPNNADEHHQVQTLVEQLRSRPGTLYDTLMAALRKDLPNPGVLLAIDQWEDIYTSTSAPESDVRAFVEQILDATSHERSGLVRVVATIRAESLGKALDYRPMADRMQDRQVNLGPMSIQELESAVVKPAQAVGLMFETGLVRRILDDVEGAPGGMPLLEYVLNRLWHNRSGDTMTHQSYDNLEGVRGALATRASEVYGEFTDVEKKSVERIFLELVRLDEEGLHTRKRIPLRTVTEISAKVTTKLIDERLIVTSAPLGEPEMAEVSHEALVRHWQPLRNWLNDSREVLLWRDRFRNRFAEWLQKPHDEARLLSGSLLAEAVSRSSRHPEALTKEQHAFIAVSRQAEELLVSAAEERRKAEAENVRADLLRTQRERERFRRQSDRERSVKRILAGAVAVAVSAFLAVAVLFGRNQRQNDATEALIEAALRTMREKLEPLGRLDLMDEMHSGILAYAGQLGTNVSERVRFVILKNTADIRLAQGKLDDATDAYETACALADRLHQQHPRSADMHHALLSCYFGKGDVLAARGKPEDALAAFRRAGGVAAELTRMSPGNDEWLRQVWLSDVRIGSVQLGRGEPAQARTRFENAARLANQLLEKDPSNDSRIRDVAICNNKLGNAALAIGDLGGASRYYELFKGAVESLAEKDPSNAEWQTDLAVALTNLADVAVQQGATERALAMYSDSRKLRDRLSNRDPDNGLRRFDLARVTVKTADLHAKTGRFDDSLRAYDQARAFLEFLVHVDPRNPLYLRELYTVQSKTGMLFKLRRLLPEALARYSEAHKVATALKIQDPLNATWIAELEAVDLGIAELKARILSGE